MKTIIDNFNIDDIIKLNEHNGPVATRIRFYDKDGKCYKESTNRQVLAGSQLTACRQFGLEEVVSLPNYNREIGIDTSDTEGDNKDTCCLWLAGNSGCGTKQNDIYPVTFASRIHPDNIIPFQYRKFDDDLTSAQRETYFGRKIDTTAGRIAYYYKAFDSEPQLKIHFIDGTQINSDIYNITSKTRAVCYVEVKLRITTTDFRDWYLITDSIGNARINTISLLTAHKVDNGNGTVEYKNVKPLTQTNFSNDWYNDLTKACSINYQIFY